MSNEIEDGTIKLLPEGEESKEEKKDEFVWTDELVKEFGRQWAAGILPDENPIEQFKASKQRKAYRITDDGKQLFEGDELYYVTSNFNVMHIKTLSLDYPPTEFVSILSTEAAAREYVRLNKPMYSLNDVGDAWEKLCHEAFTYDQLITELEKLKQ